ncbi:hypothetical protein [Aquamicrobium ahrensii]
MGIACRIVAYLQHGKAPLRATRLLNDMRYAGRTPSGALLFVDDV